jgi:hypothetical protein
MRRRRRWSRLVASRRVVREEEARTHLVDVRISEFHRSESDAYLVQPMTILEIAGGKQSSESGLISSQIWTTKP